MEGVPVRPHLALGPTSFLAPNIENLGGRDMSATREPQYVRRCFKMPEEAEEYVQQLLDIFWVGDEGVLEAVKATLEVYTRVALKCLNDRTKGDDAALGS
jgi:hypothetical protein